MTTGITVQSQSPGSAHADLGFRLATLINGQPMAMRERELSLLVEAIASNRFTLPRNRKTNARITEQGTAIVEVHGILIDRWPVLGSFWGLASYEGLAEQFRRLATHDEVKRIVLDIDSPGGMVTGIQACSAELAKLAEKKPVFAIAHNMACSAGYWIACVAQELAVTADGEVGSIGVRAGHVSYAEALERDGVAVTMFKAGATKTDFSPYALLDPGAAAEEQFGIDRAYDRFIDHVAKHRGMSAEDVRSTDARTFAGSQAVEVGLADRVETLEELVERIEKQQPKAKRRPATQQSSRTGAKPSERPATPAEDQPTAGKSHKRGARLMSERTPAEAQDFAEMITAALAPLREAASGGSEAPKETPAASQSAPDKGDRKAEIDAAVEAAMSRVFGILEAEEAKERPKLAMTLAKSGIAVDAAKAILGAAAVEKPAAKEGDGDKAELAAALERQVAKSGNTAGIKPEADGSSKKKPFSQLCAETPSKKKG